MRVNNKSGNLPIQYWSLSIDEASKILNTSQTGLSEEEVKSRLAVNGPNSIKAKSKATGLKLFLSQFKSPITLILIGAAILSLFLKDSTDATIILIIVGVSSLLGFWQEYGANNAIAKLLKMVHITTRVRRGGQEYETDTETVVPGDIILLSTGDIIPADSLIVNSQDLFADEASFTGETYPVEKEAGILPADTPLSKKTNTLFMGSHIISGTATALVTGTGRNTEFGKISERLVSKIPETGFEAGIRKFGYMLMQVTIFLVLIIFAANVLLHKPLLDSFLFSLALAVGLTPQLLPVIITINLSAGAKKMAAKQVIVKRLSAIENFGSMDILCSDKTGTITQGKVVLDRAVDYEGKADDNLLMYAWLNATLQKGFRNPIDEAIAEAYKNKKPDYIVKDEVPYDFIRKRLSIVVGNTEGNIAITKGALNNILAVCTDVENSDGTITPLNTDILEGIQNQYAGFSQSGLRTLGVCWKKVNESPFTKENESNMVFKGFITFLDPPKNGIIDTIKRLENMGVNLKIITGDNALVAKTLAEKIGIPNPVVVTGSEMHQLSNEALVTRAINAHIFAEVEPNQKEQLILALKKSGNIVGYMGDGINDASALHAADVGISVDSAVDVAKEAADIVLLSQDMGVLANGIIEGRKTFTNTMKYIFMATSANFGNMFSMAGASLLLPFLPLLPKQILLTNLLTDFPATTISTDNVDASYLEKPRKIDIDFVKKFMIVFGLLSSVFDYLTFGVLLHLLNADEVHFQTGWFIESVISACLIVLVIRTEKPFLKSVPGKLLVYTTLLIVLLVIVFPYIPIGNLFNFVGLPLKFYLYMASIVLLYVFVADVVKRWFYKRFAP